MTDRCDTGLAAAGRSVAAPAEPGGGLRVAVMFFGLARRVADTRAAILRNVYACNPGISFYTLASLNLVSRVDNPRSKERAVKLDQGQALLLPADLFLLARQEDADIAGPLAIAQQRDDVFRDGWASTRNLLHQLNSLRRGWHALAGLPGRRFDHVLFLRPDLLYLDPIRIGELAAGFRGERNIALPFWESHGGHNDRFALADLAAARFYAERLDHLGTYLAQRPLHSESFLASALAEGGCRVTELPVRARRVRSTGAIVHEDFALPGEAAARRSFRDRAIGKISQHIRLPWLAR